MFSFVHCLYLINYNIILPSKSLTKYQGLFYHKCKLSHLVKSKESVKSSFKVVTRALNVKYYYDLLRTKEVLIKH